MESRGRLLLSPGDVVAGYEVEEYVARGGMAVVYRARDLMLQRRVALKLIAPELTENEKFRLRFIRESELAASIDHPNILPIYQAGEADGLLYIAMRYVQGRDLGALLAEEGALPPRLALPLFTQIAAALDTAHAHGLVHRDVKPGNILVSRPPGGSLGESHVYLTDFGLTKRSSSLSGFTTAGHFIGTIAYVAPEQISGAEVTASADIYAMGCVLYEALGGVPPFQRDDDAALLWAHMSVPPEPLTALKPDLPAAVDDVVARALAKDPADRQPTCRALVAELRAAFRPPRAGVAAPPPAPPVEPLPVAPVSPPPARTEPAAAAVPVVAPAEPAEPVEGPEAYDPADGRDGGEPPGPLPPLPAPAPRPAPGPGRRTAVLRVAAALAVVALVAAAVLLVPRLLNGGTVPYAGEDEGTSWLAFDRPKEWTPHRDRLATCFCTGNYGPVLQRGDWATVVAAIGDGVSVQGLYARQAGRISLEDAEEALGSIEDFLTDNKTGNDLVASRVTVGDRSGWQVRGTLVATKDPTLRLSIRFLIVPSDDGMNTHQLVVFARDTDAARLESRLDDAIGSVQFREGA